MARKKPSPPVADPAAFIAAAKRLAIAKAQETQAKEERLAAEEALIGAAGFRKPEGQETYDLMHGGWMVKAVLKQPINTSIDSEGWLALSSTLPEDHPGRNIFRQKFDLDTKLARELFETNRPAFVDVSDVITRRPGKVSVDLKTIARVD